jgi:hypothetical protein
VNTFDDGPEDRGCWAPRRPSGEPVFGEDGETAPHGEPSGEQQEAEESAGGDPGCDDAGGQDPEEAEGHAGGQETG